MFGMGGFQLLPFYEACRALHVQHHLINDERCGAFAADAYARVTNKPGLVDGTFGPGATNQAIKAIAIARKNIEEEAIDLTCKPEFTEVNEGVTALRMLLLVFEHLQHPLIQEFDMCHVTLLQAAHLLLQLDVPSNQLLDLGPSRHAVRCRKCLAWLFGDFSRFFYSFLQKTPENLLLLTSQIKAHI
jgi:stage V sporulation protein SpoVS